MYRLSEKPQDSERINILLGLLTEFKESVLKLGPYNIYHHSGEFEVAISYPSGETKFHSFWNGREAIDFVLLHSLENEDNSNTEREKFRPKDEEREK